MNAHKIFNLVLAFVFAFSLLGMPAPVSAQEPQLNPRIEVLDYVEHIALVDWPAGQTVHVSIDDPSTGPSPDHEQDFTPDQDGNYYEFFVAYDIKTGDIITATNGTFTKTLEVAVLQATEINPDNGVVHGVAAPNSQFDVDVWGDHFDVSPVHDVVSVDDNGEWSADYGDVPGNLLPWTWMIRGEMRQSDEDGDVTIANWHNHWGVLEVWVNEAELRAYDWELETTLTFTVDDPTTYQPVDFMEEAQTIPMTWTNHGDATVSVRGKLNLQPGMTVTVTDGIKTKTTVIQNIGFNKLDAVNDIVEGFAPENADLDIAISKDYWSHRYFSADANGDWVVDYSIPDVAGRTLDLQPGDQFQGLLMRDEEFDSTVISGHVPNPSFSAFPVEDYLNGHNWPIGETLFIEIDNPVTSANPDYTGQVSDWDPNDTFQMIDFSGQYDMRPGDIVTVTNGTITKTHIVTQYSITEIDINTDIVSGLAEPGSDIVSWICDDYGCAERYAIANQDGSWSANFSILGNSSADWGTYDFKPGTGVEASQADEDGDKTVVAMDLPNPYVQASALSDWVLANGWAEGMTVNLTINGIPYNSSVMGPASWNPGRIVGEFELEGYDIQVGDIITVEGGSVPKSLTVSMLQVLNVDPVEETVSGVASDGSSVNVCANPHNGCTVERWATAEGGVWSVDFDDEFDLIAGVDGWAAELEEDGDGTWYDWYVPALQYAPFVVLGREGVWLKENSDVMSGDVGANISASGPYLTDQSEVTIGQDVQFMDPVSRVMGDTIYLKQGSQVYDVFTNQLKGQGQILGVNHTPLELPLVPQLPAVPNVTPGTQNFDLKKNSTLTLGAGSYGKLETKKGAVITFTGGVYHFSEWNLGDDAKVYFTAPTEIRIAGKLNIGSDAFIGPATSTQLTASDIFIYVMGENGKNGKINASPKAAMFGTKTTLIANVYAPYGTLWIHERSTATGAFFGNWVEIGQNVTLTLENGLH